MEVPPVYVLPVDLDRISVPVPAFVMLELVPEIVLENVVFVLLMLNVRDALLPRATVPSKIKSPVPATLKRPPPEKRIELEIVRVVLSLLCMKLVPESPVFAIVKVPVPNGPLVTLPGLPV